MHIRTPVDLGALIRQRRTALGLSQKSLADKVRVSRQWIVEVEKGKPTAEVGLVLRTMDCLGILLAADRYKQEAGAYLHPSTLMHLLPLRAKSVKEEGTLSHPRRKGSGPCHA
jgi:HTH-type transcriptional regulator/antitoxin HipB